MISALQHYIYCPRQCGLIHVDNAWQENLFTTTGNILHEKVDTDTFETRHGVKTVRGLRIHSFTFGIVGRCDVVEFKETSTQKEITPVEYKAGEPKEDLSDKVQLCAQAFCLEEMLGTTIQQGAFFYGKIRRRSVVELDEPLRNETIKVIEEVRKIISSQKVPPAVYSDKCRNCSLYSICQPKAMNNKKFATYMRDLYMP